MPRIELQAPGRRWPFLRRLTALLTMLAVVGGVGWAWEQGYRPSWLAAEDDVVIPLVEVERGDIAHYVVEYGTLESASDTIVRCQVEALVGMVGGSSGSSTRSTSLQVAGASAAAGRTASASVALKSSSKSDQSKNGDAKADSSGASGSSKPKIRSFSYSVPRYSPLVRSSGTSASANARGAGGRGGDGSGERLGSTRIISILPEGTPVKQGDIVCELDSAAFRDELKLQQVRWLQAKSYVEQAAALLAVNEITLQEYRDGIFPQDLQLIRQYVQTCEIDRNRAADNLEWSQGVRAKGLQTSSQLRASELALEQAEFVLSEAQGMLLRLEKFTGPKILKTLEAKLASILTDKLAQDASFALEDERLKRLEKNIAACTLRAPAEGLVVYVNETNGWGRVESYIQEGVTVRQDQPIFQLPDPQQMRIKARINETKVSMLRVGQQCRIRIDAFTNRPLFGRVTDVTAISSPVNGPFSDVRVYFAMIAVENPFEELRPGLSAEVTFLHDRRSQVERLPLASVRHIDGASYVAVPEPPETRREKPSYRWQKVDLGLSDSDYVEVLSGVRLGEQVVADPIGLELAMPASNAPTPSQVASATP